MTTAQLLEANPGLVLRLNHENKIEEAFRGRCLAKMAEIVKAAKKGEPCEVTEFDAADISRFLRDLSAKGVGQKLVSAMSKHPGMIHND